MEHHELVESREILYALGQYKLDNDLSWTKLAELLGWTCNHVKTYKENRYITVNGDVSRVQRLFRQPFIRYDTAIKVIDLMERDYWEFGL